MSKMWSWGGSTCLLCLSCFTYLIFQILYFISKKHSASPPAPLSLNLAPGLTPGGSSYIIPFLFKGRTVAEANKKIKIKQNAAEHKSTVRKFLTLNLFILSFT